MSYKKAYEAIVMAVNANKELLREADASQADTEVVISLALMAMLETEGLAGVDIFGLLAYAISQDIEWDFTDQLEQFANEPQEVEDEQ